MLTTLVLIYKRGLISISDMQREAKTICESWCDEGLPKCERDALKEIIAICDNTISKKDKEWWEWDRDYLNMFYISPVVYSAI